MTLYLYHIYYFIFNPITRIDFHDCPKDSVHYCSLGAPFSTSIYVLLAVILYLKNLMNTTLILVSPWLTNLTMNQYKSGGMLLWRNYQKGLSTVFPISISLISIDTERCFIVFIINHKYESFEGNFPCLDWVTSTRLLDNQIREITNAKL